MTLESLELIPEHRVPGKPLGRHVWHDGQSRDYPVRRMSAGPLRTVLHRRHVPLYDQGDLGSCTGNAAAGAASTSPFHHRYRSERTAVRFYSLATQTDPYPGSYPPDDTGSSGLAVAKVLLSLKLISRYEHAFSLQQALEALQDGPVITGVDWMDSFDRPVGSAAELVISPDAQVRGGHEFEVLGIDVESRTVRACNSWGPGWGDGGYMTLSFGTWSALLARRGDVTVFRP